MKKLNLLLLLFVISFRFLAAQDAPFQKFRCIWNDDPATTMTIGFVGHQSGTVYFDVIDHGTDYWNYAFQQAPDRQQWSKNMSNYFVRLKNLEPDTKYYFVVSDEVNVSERYWFQTISNNDTSRLSFIMGGDNRRIADIYEPTGRINGNKMVAKLRAHAVLFTGDMTIHDTAEEWQVWLDDWQLTIAEDGRMTPFVTARGNHEYHTDENSLYNLFDLPHVDAYYALTFGESLLRVYMLNTNISIGGDQAIWLENDLAENTCTYWKTALYHHPTRPHSSAKGDRNWQRDEWSTRFDHYGLQLAVEGDAHLVKMTYPISVSDDWNDPNMIEGFVRNDDRGVTYIGEGGWGATLRMNDDDKAWTRASGSFNQFKWIFIDKDKMEIRTVKIDHPDTVVAKVEGSDIFAEPENIELWDAPGTGTVLILRNANNPLKVNLAPQRYICTDCAAIINAGYGFESYLWSTGETSRAIYVTEPGLYSVTVTNRGLCESSSSMEVIYYTPPATIDVDTQTPPSTQSTLSIEHLFPNPAHLYTEVRIFTPNNLPVHYKIRSLSGQLVKQRTLALPAGENEFRLSLKDVQNGLYFLEVQQGNQRVVERFIRH